MFLRRILQRFFYYCGNMLVSVGVITFVLASPTACQNKRVFKQFPSFRGPYSEYSNCSEQETVSEELKKWIGDAEFQFYVPKSSCFVCFKPPCPPSGCPEIANTPKMIIYNNLFEFGLFTFNLPDKNFFRIAINDKCYFKVDVIVKRDVNQICISIHECEFSAMKDNDCREEIYEAIWQDPDFTKGCVMIALAFVERDKVHYSISFDCTYIPSTLLSDEKTFQILSTNCHFNKEKDTPVVEYHYFDDRIRLPNGVSLILPCSPGGYAVDKKTGRFVSEDICEDIVRTELVDVGFDFVIKRIYNGSEDLLFPISVEAENIAISSIKPLYTTGSKLWRTYLEMKPITKRNRILENKIRQGCKILDALPITSSPETTLLTTDVEESTLGIHLIKTRKPDVEPKIELTLFDVGEVGENVDQNFNGTGLVKKVQRVRNETPEEAEAGARELYDFASGIDGTPILNFETKILTFILNKIAILLLG